LLSCARAEPGPLVMVVVRRTSSEPICRAERDAGRPERDVIGGPGPGVIARPEPLARLVDGAGKLLFVTFLLGGALLGCPLYDEDCSDGRGCARGYACDRFSNRCEPVAVPPSCVRPEDCAAAETCTPDFACRPGSCDFHGCVSGFTCGVVDGAHACVASLGDAGGGTDAGAPLSDAAVPVAPGAPADAGDAGAAVPGAVVPAVSDAGDASTDAGL
jgi:hypothetical protein